MVYLRSKTSHLACTWDTILPYLNTDMEAQASFHIRVWITFWAMVIFGSERQKALSCIADTIQLQRSFRAACSWDVPLVAALHRMLGHATSQQGGEASAGIQGDQAHQAAVLNVLKAALSPLEDAKVRILINWS